MPYKTLKLKGKKKLTIGSNKKLTIDVGTGDDTFFPEPVRSLFTNFTPEFTLSNDGTSLKLTSISYALLKAFLSLGGLSLTDEHLQVGVIITKHHKNKRNKKHVLSDLPGNPLNATVCWGGTFVGKMGTANRQYVHFSLDSTKESLPILVCKDNNGTAKPGILSLIYPEPNSASSDYRAQDKNHSYYYIGLIFRIRRDNTNDSVVCTCKPSQTCIELSHDNSGIKTSMSNSYIYQ